MMVSIKLKRISLLFILWFGMFVLSSGAFAVDISECVQKGIGYLQSVQNEDGGFPSDKGHKSNPMVTDWVVMALRAAGEDPNDVRWSKKGLTPSDYILNQERSLELTTDYARTLLALTALNSGTVYQGIDLAEKIVSWQLPHGQFAQSELGEEVLLSGQLWSVLALTAADQEIPQCEEVLSWLVSQQNSDGGFGWAVGGESDPDDTGVALSALAVLGLTKDDLVVQKALQYLKEQQNEDGGFSWTDQKTNAATDSWVIQGLSAVGEDPAGNNWRVQGVSPLDHLCSLQNSDGSFQWVSGLDSSPVLMTAYAVIALSGGSLPVNLKDTQNFADAMTGDMIKQQNKNNSSNLTKLSTDICRLFKNMLRALPQFLWL